MKLTKTQKIAVEGKDKNILISAGAGTGKTRVLVERFLHFVTSGEALVTEILALTFTDKAANEMKQRILDRLEELGRASERQQLELAYISTIHSFATRVLREHPLEAKVDPHFRVLEQVEAGFLKEQALEEVFEEFCVPESETFEFLNRYGLDKTRDGILKVFHTARNEGKSLETFFDDNRRGEPVCSPGDRDVGLTHGSAPTNNDDAYDQIPDTRYQIPDFESLGEEELAGEWKQYAAIEDWQWQTVEEYKAWLKTFSRKRKEGWSEVKEICKEFLARKMTQFAKPWQEKFENIAKTFEERYENLKQENGALDFDDLQIRVVELFKNPSPVHQKLRDRYRFKFRQVMVDEFQDTNYLQYELIKLLENKSNLFFVGDYKQSIYAFRGAEPRLFLEIEKDYAEAEENASFKMLENFRTQENTLEWINRFFEALWSEDDDTPFDALIARRVTEDDQGAAVRPEVEALVIEPGEGEKVDILRMKEADVIAEHMLDLEEEGVSFGDMVVLFRAMSDIGIYEQALKKRGIPYYALSARGFYHQPEIRDMMNFVTCLENPFLDIPLAAVLRSPIVQINDDTLFWLSREAKAEDPKAALYLGLQSFDKVENITDAQKERLQFFKELLAELRAVKDRLRMTELLDLILSKTFYELNVLADPQGVRKYANLRKLINIAREAERYGSASLGDFIRMVKRLATQEVRESEAQVEAEASGRVVRLMTIHRAKGLEFPVVFVADMGKSKQSIEAKTFQAKSGAGYGLQVYNPAGKCWEKPSNWQNVDRALNAKEEEERKRLFYVALTRAKDRLVLCGSYKEKKKQKETYSEMSSWMEWLMASVGLHDVMKIRKIKKMLPKKRKRAIAERRDLSDIFSDFNPHDGEDLIKSEKERAIIKKECEKILEATEEYRPEPGRVIDLPVSAFALFGKSREDYRRIYEIGYRDTLMPDEKREGVGEPSEISAADFGTHMHLVLERLDFKNPGVRKDQIVHECFKSLGPENEKKAHEILEGFLKSDIFKQLSKAKTVKKEVPFILNERHGLIHGIIDVLFQDEKDAWHVLDYKTAVGDELKMKESGYDLQIAIYAMAVHELLDVNVASGIVYFLKNNWQQKMELTPEILESQRDQIRALQENILEFSLQT